MHEITKRIMHSPEMTASHNPQNSLPSTERAPCTLRATRGTVEPKNDFDPENDPDSRTIETRRPHAYTYYVKGERRERAVATWRGMLSGDAKASLPAAAREEGARLRHTSYHSNAIKNMWTYKNSPKLQI